MTDMTEVITVIKTSPIGGDCQICFEPLELETNIRTKEEFLVCTNKLICGEKYKFKTNKIYFK